jgi:hypothetical protein
MDDTGLILVVLTGGNSIVDKIVICWWHLRKRSPCKFLNNSKLLGNSKVTYRPKRNKVSKMPQQSLDKILDLRVTGIGYIKTGCKLGHAYNGLKFK